MTEIILKGELHSSTADLNEERELVKQGIDVLILESTDPELEENGPWYHGWFEISVKLFFWILSSVYVSKTVIEDLADFQNAEIRYTRDTNYEILNNASLPMKILGATIFYILFTTSLAIGIMSGPELSIWEIAGATILFASILIPPYLIRTHNMRHSSKERNRDSIIAGKIIESTTEETRVLTIVGEDHVPDIKKNLPKNIQPKTLGPVYGEWSYPHLREIAAPCSNRP